MKFQFKWSQTALLAAGLLFTALPHANAIVILGFDDAAGGSGLLSYNGTGGSLVGSDILIDRITGSGTPLNSGVQLSVTNGELNFATGANISEGGPWTFNGGGTFTITGTVFNGMTQIATGTLVSGTFTGTPSINNDTVFATFNGFGLDSKNADLLAFFGITDSEFVFANTEISALLTPTANGGFTANVVNSDVNNTPRVPDGGSIIVMLSLALIGVEGFRRKYLA